MKYVYLIFFFAFSVLAEAQTDIDDWQNVRIDACLENDQVKAFMENVTYNGLVSRDHDYKSYSKVSKYASVETSYRKDQPAPVIIPLPEATTEVMQLTYFDKDNLEDTTIVDVPVGSDTIRIWNLVPDHTYCYNVGDLTKGEIHTTGQLRQIRVDSGFNVRDLGGYPTENGYRIGYGMIYRGCELANGVLCTLTEEDLQELSRIGVKSEIDLRKGSVQDSAVIDVEQPFLHLYWSDCITILTDYKDDIRKAIEFIYTNLDANRPVYIHCTFGADRTGTLCALLEAMCGVAIGDIYKDYELTTMADDIIPNDLKRYYYIINQRIVRPLNITDADNVTTAVRNYLINDCGVSRVVLDDLVTILTNQDRTPVFTDNNQIPSTSVQATYNLQGMPCSSISKGIKILRMADGSVRKVIR